MKIPIGKTLAWSEVFNVVLLWVGVISCCSVSALDTICDFRQAPIDGLIWNQAKMVKRIKSGKEGLPVDWNMTEHRTGILTVSPRRTIPFPAFRCSNCYVTVEVPDNSPIRFMSVRFRDSCNEIFQWRVATEFPHQGVYRIKIPLDPEKFFAAYQGNRDRKIDFPMYFVSCVMNTIGYSRPVTLSIKTIEYESAANSDLTQVKFDLDTGYVARVLKKGEEDKLTLLFTSPGNKDIPCRAKLTFTDVSGREVTEKGEFTIPAQGTWRYRPRVTLPRLGIWYVTARLDQCDRTGFAEFTRSLAYMVPAGPTPGLKTGFVFGVCIPGWYKSEVFPLEAETAALCGVKSLRLNFRWRELERQPGKWNFSLLDKLMKDYQDRGIELMPILSNPPAWSRNKEGLPDYQAWSKYVRLVLDRYQRQIRFWEIWNEPDLLSFAQFGAPEYVNLLRLARKEQQQRAPQVKILTGGFTTMNPHQNIKNGFQEYALENGRGCYDVHAFHGHGSFAAYVDQIENKFLPMRKRLGINVPWFANETAISACGIGELKQAETFYKKFLFSWSAGAIGYNWYNLRNNGFKINDPEHHYGLVSCDFYPKAVFVVYNTVATLFHEMKFSSRHSSSPGIWLLEFAGQAGRAVAMWNEAPGEVSDALAVFRVPATATVMAIDLMGNAEPVANDGGLVIQRVTAVPRTLIVQSADEITYCGDIIRVTGNDYAVPGGTTCSALRIHNPYPHSVSYRLKLLPRRGMTVDRAVHAGELVAGANRIIPFRLSLPKTDSLPEGLKIALTMAEKQWEVILPLHRAFLISSYRDEGRWNFLLERRDQVKSLFDADPFNADKLWQGSKDLSAKVRLGYDSGSLHLKVVVTDDKHVQPERGFAIWQGDSIQLAFQVPGRNTIWVAGAALRSDGKPEIHLWDYPGSLAPDLVTKSWRLRAGRQGNQTTYDLTIPLNSVGLTPALLRQGIRFNLLVNDNDGFGRKSWIQIADGIAGNRVATKYPFLIFETD